MDDIVKYLSFFFLLLLPFVFFLDMTLSAAAAKMELRF